MHTQTNEPEHQLLYHAPSRGASQLVQLAMQIAFINKKRTQKCTHVVPQVAPMLHSSVMNMTTRRTLMRCDSCSNDQYQMF